MAFINDEFLLRTTTSRRLYHLYAENQPILDYHSHLPPGDIATNRQFRNLFEIWLEGDHYKWRAMRANGEPESHCTGNSTPKDKFLAWARTVPHTLRNPLYHWTHLELKRYFGIELLLSESTAERIWDQTQEQLASPEFRVQSLLQRFQVKAVCTTDDPTDDLAHHKAIQASKAPVRVFPTFRPDKALTLQTPKTFLPWISKLEAITNRSIDRLDDLLAALKQRHDTFHQMGGRLSDHGLPYCYSEECSDHEAAAIFEKARTGNPVTPEEHKKYASHMMLWFGRWDAQRGWTKQLHLGALRNNNGRLFESLGPDIGCDSIGDWPQAEGLSNYFNRLDQENLLPKIVVYNLNPRDNYLIATMMGNFQRDTPGKMQFGSGWWFLDQKEAMEWQINALSNMGLLSRFIGMLTDSRSFMSFPRHEYFRRVLCHLFGKDIEEGEIPDNEEWVGKMIGDICYRNAHAFLGLDIP